jgi:hypothetical protein
MLAASYSPDQLPSWISKVVQASLNSRTWRMSWVLTDLDHHGLKTSLHAEIRYRTGLAQAEAGDITHLPMK